MLLVFEGNTSLNAVTNKCIGSHFIYVEFFYSKYHQLSFWYFKNSLSLFQGGSLPDH